MSSSWWTESLPDKFWKSGKMQQASLGDCNKNSGNVDLNLQLSKNVVTVKNEIEGDPGEDDRKAKVKVKLEVVEEVVLEPKTEVQEDYGRRDEYREVKPTSIPTSGIADYSKFSGFCPPPNPGYRPVGTGFPPGFGFSHFYGHSTTFANERLSVRANTGTIHREDRQFGPGVINDNFFHDTRFDTSFHQGKVNYSGVPFSGYRPPVSQRSYLEQRNNSHYNRSQYSSRQRKWSNSALRGLQPPTPVSFFESFDYFICPCIINS